MTLNQKTLAGFILEKEELNKFSKEQFSKYKELMIKLNQHIMNYKMKQQEADLLEIIEGKESEAYMNARLKSWDHENDAQYAQLDIKALCEEIWFPKEDK